VQRVCYISDKRNVDTLCLNVEMDRVGFCCEGYQKTTTILYYMGFRIRLVKGRPPVI